MVTITLARFRPHHVKCCRKRDVITGTLLDGYNEGNNGESEPARRQGDLSFGRRWCKLLSYWESHSEEDILDPRTRQAFSIMSVWRKAWWFTLHCISFLFKKKHFLKEISSLCGPLIPLVWTSGVICPVFQSQGWSPRLHIPLSACNRLLRFTSGVTPADFLAATMAAESLSMHVLYNVSHTRT